MKEQHVLVYFEATPDSQDGFCDYGIRCGRLEQYLKALGHVGLKELLDSMNIVQEKIVTEYLPRAIREREAAELARSLERQSTTNGDRNPFYEGLFPGESEADRDERIKAAKLSEPRKTVELPSLCESCGKADVSCPIYPQELLACGQFERKPV